MKKSLSFVIVLAVMMSLCVSAFAADSPKPDPAPTQKGGIEITDASKVDVEKGTYPVNGTFPSKALKTVAINQAEKLLSEEDGKAFKAAYEEAQAMEDCKVYKCYWMYVDEELADGFKGVSSSSALAIKFTCPGKDVRFLVNGNEMQVISKGGSSYIAIVTETGTVTITCEK